MKKLVAIFVIYLIYSTAAYCQHPYNLNLGGIAIITFPDTPKTRIVKSKKFYICNYDKCNYAAQILPLSDDSTDAEVDNLDSLFSGFFISVRKKINGPILYKNKITISNSPGYEFGFKSISNGKTYFGYQRVLYFDEVLIDYSFLTADSLRKNDKKIESFFKTFKTTISEYQIRQRNDVKLGHTIGKMVVALIEIGLVALIVFGIVYTIKKYL
jgi:hypothetical protein